MTDHVEYRTIERFQGYRFGSDGSVWTAWHRAGRGSYISETWKRLVACVHPKSGYGTITLRVANGTQERRAVHQVIAEAFHGPCPAGKEVRHFPDAAKTNNRADNLVYGTRAENHEDKRAQGIMRCGERSHLAKITAEQVSLIRSEYSAGGISQAALGRKHGIGQAQVSRIVRRKEWTDAA